MKNLEPRFLESGFMPFTPICAHLLLTPSNARSTKGSITRQILLNKFVKNVIGIIENITLLKL